ncbi:hypothetical protein GCM10023115_42120 [Pontixanthobacter gangjinensis]|uniref:DUF4136 domain-containing protein n=1 Tax=Christiangramia aestuarii TaxID=1028746 RepID=A0A7M3SYL6_9FLAO|nr:DUF4136 domain-containing protein [Christiangramia aestuarii]MUP41697.1 DUF4136 domain-containing protein [Christiangramia aestuarii]
MRLFKFSILLLLITSCNAPQAVYDYDQDVNFSQYSEYALFPDFRTGLSQLDEARLIESLKTQMQAEGLSLSEDPGIYVNVYTEKFEQDNRSRVGVGIGGGGGNVGVGVSGGIPVGQMDTYLQLTFDFIDVENDALIWQAVVESPFSFNAEPQERQQRFSKIVEKALAGFPPKK